MSYLGIFRLGFENTIIIFEISTLEFFKMQSFKTKILKVRTKVALFGYFWAGIWENHGHIWNEHPQKFLKAKLSAKKKKTLKLWPKMPYLSNFGLEFESCLKSAS